MSLADSFSLDELTQRCTSETEKFNRREPSDARFCFELLRRALADRLSDAFTRVYQIYERQVLIWVHAPQRFCAQRRERRLFCEHGLEHVLLRAARPQVR